MRRWIALPVHAANLASAFGKVLAALPEAASAGSSRVLEDA